MIGRVKKGNVYRIHCAGIGGVGMSGIAEILHAHGYQVTGSDLAPTQTTLRLNRLGIPIHFQPNNQFVSNADLLIYSSAIPSHHPERQYAKSSRIPCLSRGEALGSLMEGYTGIAVAGTHGKTSTVGLVSQLLQYHHLDPTIIIGGYLNHLESNAAFGEGSHFIAEADESDGSLLFLKPKIGVLTQIDKDHLGHYDYDFNRLIQAYRQFIEQTQAIAILSCDDPILAHMIRDGLKTKVLSYGFEKGAMVRGSGFYQSRSALTLTILRDQLKQVPLTVTVPLLGKHNAYNVLAAIAVATYLKIPDQVIQQSLKSYRGVARRLESLGKAILPQGEINIFDDYGHHPREIEASVQAVRAAFPNRRIVLVFQAHRYTRTRDLLNDFSEVLARIADELLLLPIYAAHEMPISGVDHFLLADAIRQKGGKPILVDAPLLHQSLHQWLRKDDIVLFQGAGSIGQIAKDFQTTWMHSEES